MPETQQPDWSCVGHVGDVDPIAYGGGFVYVDKTGVYAPELTWFVPGDDSEWQEKAGKTEIGVYRLILENNPEGEWWWKKRMEVAEFAGIPVQALEAEAKGSPWQRALTYDSLIHYFGPFEFDQYPMEMTEDEAYEKYADEMAVARGRS